MERAISQYFGVIEKNNVKIISEFLAGKTNLSPLKENLVSFIEKIRQSHEVALESSFICDLSYEKTEEKESIEIRSKNGFFIFSTSYRAKDDENPFCTTVLIKKPVTGRDISFSSLKHKTIKDIEEFFATHGHCVVTKKAA